MTGAGAILGACRDLSRDLAAPDQSDRLSVSTR